MSRVRGLAATVYLRRKKKVVGLMDTDGAVEALGHRKIKEYGGIKQRNLLYQWIHFNSFLIYLLYKSYQNGRATPNAIIFLSYDYLDTKRII